MSSDSERHCCTLFQTQAFQACLRLHSPHRAPRLHRSAQALFLQRRSHFSPSNGDTVGNASSFGSLSPFPGTMSCRRVWSSAVAHPCHRTNARTLPFCNLTHAGAASVCQYPLSAGGGYQVRHCIVQCLSGTNAYSTTAPRPWVHCFSHGTGVVARA